MPAPGLGDLPAAGKPYMPRQRIAPENTGVGRLLALAAHPAIVGRFVATSSPRKRARSMRARSTSSRAKPYHHGDLTNALLQTAAQVIEEQGVGELRVRDLTRRLGVSHGAPANHFKDRNDLLVALGVQGFERLTEHQRAAREREHATPMDALQRDRRRVRRARAR